MTRLACSAACVFEEFGALAVRIQRKRVHNQLVALLTVPAYDRLRTGAYGLGLR